MFGRFVNAVFLAAVTSTYATNLSKYPVLQFTAQLLAFHGDQTNYDINNTVGMRWAGHLGIRYAQSTDDIYGFMPASPPSMSIFHLIDALLNGTSFEGNVNLNNDIFELSFLSPYGFTAVFYDVPPSKCLTPDCGYALLQEDLRATSISHKFYAFPPSAPRTYRNHNYSACDHTWRKLCFNCATYTTSLGIEEVETSGMFDTYIPALAAQATAHCRCFVSGEWVHHSLCVRDHWSTCRYEDPVLGNVLGEEKHVDTMIVNSVHEEEL